MKDEGKIPYPRVSDRQNFVRNAQFQVEVDPLLHTPYGLSNMSELPTSQAHYRWVKKFGHIYLFVQILLKACQIPSTVLDSGHVEVKDSFWYQGVHL